MEAKLKEYRALRRRKELLNSAKEKLENSKQKLIDLLTPKSLKMSKEKEDEVVLIENEIEESPSPKFIPIQPDDTPEEDLEGSDTETVVDEKQESWKYFTIKWLIYSIIWITLFLFFLKIQFGAVFFVISVLFGIYFNTRTRPKKKGEISAYSVFNENCGSINGTLKAEELEKQMIYGVAGIIR